MAELNFTYDRILIVTFSTANSKNIFPMVLFLMCVTLVKLMYQWSHKYIQYFPESSMLLFLGIAFGLVLKTVGFSHSMFEVNSYIFMYILLPPIVLESAFSMYHADFMANIIGVLIFAIIATVLNFICLSVSLWLLMNAGVLGNTINIISILLFCSLITSVDPVAVLAIFQQIHVDNNMYYLVFGESLLNDGVCVVLYNVLKQLAAIKIWTGMHYFKSCIAFVAVAVGGGIIGVLVSSITCIMTRFTYNTPLAEPLIVFNMSILTWLIADALGWSTIISMIIYGLIQVAYNFHNITHKSLIVIKRLIKILANLSESIIFLNLGVTLSNEMNLEWYSPFSMWSLFLCIYVRFIITFLLSGVINRFKLTVRRIEWNEQFIMAYGGMRGGIAYCLAILLTEDYNIDKDSIRSATIFIVIFTTVFMGITMKPLVALLEIKIAGQEELSLINEINDSIIQHTLANIEAILDMKGRYSFNEFANQVNALFIRPVLQRNPVNYESKLMNTYRAIDFRLYMAYSSGFNTPLAKHYMEKLKPNLRHNRFGFYDLTDIYALAEMMRESPAELYEIPSNELDYDMFMFSETTQTTHDPRKVLMKRVLELIKNKGITRMISTDRNESVDKRDTRLQKPFYRNNNIRNSTINELTSFRGTIS